MCVLETFDFEGSGYLVLINTPTAERVAALTEPLILVSLSCEWKKSK